MKIYEKPLALVENLEVEDVIAASLMPVDSANAKSSLLGNTDGASDTDNVIVFQW